MHSSSFSTCARTPIDQERPALVCRMRYRARTDAERLDFRSTRVCERDGSEHERTSRRILSAGVVNCSDEGVLDVCAQARLSDKDIELMMKNLTEDAKKFRFSTRPSATARSKKRHARRMRKRLPSGSRTTPRRCCVSFRNSKKADARYQSSCKAPATSSE
jgi:hypothetical protein